MLRSLLSVLLALAFVVEAAAQSAPATKTTKATATKTTRTSATRNTTMKPAAGSASASKSASSGGRNDIGPGGNGAVGSTEAADGKGQSIYAAPGMPVNVDNPKNVQGYNGPAPTRTKSRTTLTPR
ncbi:hypothetical protein ACFST9_24490 [Hymenobacter monticola]|uniref:Uncharacterized protein n=1 Tax=Hymenobacter monticola TaxID=1705399 RepID=A0ABY4B6S4_9BACT|nr:hypothetical protein [Hymenobacter monticola]UOE34866.1 hypothetical protein MTP16_04240 [Hymenobacter monticola]